MKAPELFFYFSYDRNDDQCREKLQALFDRLSSRLLERGKSSGETITGESGFADWSTVEPGDWSDAVSRALQNCSVFVPVYSRGYFASRYCGKECQAFLNRLDLYQNQNTSRPPLVLPILWDNPGQLPKPLPPAISAFDYLRGEMGGEYYERGLNYLWENGAFVTIFVEKHSDRIVELADQFELPRLTDFPPFESIPSAFGEPAPQEAETAGPIVDVRPSSPDFNADIYTERDLLDIEDDVESFARLIAARRVIPPLSIGLFGDWGSGKSFFMQHLKNRVDAIMKLAQGSGKAQKEIDYYKRIAQIEFNAWHYGEGNLWASLVEHIFQNLTIKGEHADALKERQAELLKQLTTEQMSQQLVQAAEDAEIKKLAEKENEIKDVERQQEEEIASLAVLREKDILSIVATSVQLDPKVREQVEEALSEAGLDTAYVAARDFQAALSEAQAMFGRGSNVLFPMVGAKDGKDRFKRLLILLIGAPLVGLVVAVATSYLKPQISQFAGYASTFATLLAAGAAWVRKQTSWMADRLRRIEQAKRLVDKQLEEKVAAVRSDYAKQIESHRQQLDLLKSKVLGLRQERDETQRRVERIQAELKQITPVQLLAGFIQDRAASDDYRKHLGVLALIRRDFEKLSNLMQLYNESLEKADLKQEEANAERVIRINRIVLYIDDLDRCPPHKVVAVLQAVHLLLAFPLFVVVVGVDERWVAHSLRKQYRDLLTTDVNGSSSATPRDYLEKIFQIPFWLEPMQDDNTTMMLDGLLEKHLAKPKSAIDKEKESGHPPGGLPKQADVGADPLQQGGRKVNVGDSTREEERKQSSEGESNTSKRGDEPKDQGGAGKQKRDFKLEFDLKPKSLEIDKEELKYMKALAPILGKSPRAVKRFVNIYLLIKVGLAPGERADFLRDVSGMGRFKVVMWLLAIATGMPSISRQIFEALMSEDQQTLGDLIKILDSSLMSNPEWRRLVNWIVITDITDNGPWHRLELRRLAGEAKQISRYSFAIKQV